ncbi:copper resistance protein CopC [Nocardioides sp. Root190]|uniref:copper resistance CopC/CopD family protein n=1 Tax=Nocardioides sp. Root190 TaxID=1736488 RepID=UPI0006F29455|nr:copper resistance protein CopC [Nocardioides sp. Root190]KRB76178.1 copper resistance protein CopC [Nocardioides sp. Root190]
MKRRLLALLLAAIALLLAVPSPAQAHATLVSSDPAQGAVLTEAPDSLRFTFSEHVSLVPDGVRIFDAEGEELDADPTARGSELEVDLGDDLGTGTLVVVWRVVSEDGHPISGSLAFSIGAPSAQVVAPPVTGDESTGPPWLLSVAAWAGYVALLLSTGLVAFVVLFLPGHHLADRARARLVRAARVGAVTAAIAWLLGIPLTAVYQIGSGVGALAKGSTWAALDPLEYVVTATVVLGVSLAVVLLGRGLIDRPRRVVALVACGVAACAPALTGHTRAATPEVLAVGADMLHLVAGSVWLGGLVALVLVLPDLGGRRTLAAEVLARFSVVAAGVLVALVITGAFLAWRVAGSWSVLFETGYGRLLLVKILAALIAVLIAAWNRFALVPRLQDASRRRERRDSAHLLVRTTAAEAGVLVAVLLVTGFLVDRSPEPAPASAVSSVPAEPEVRTALLGGLTVRGTIAPPRTGPSTVTVEIVDATGAPTEGFEAPRLRLSSGEVDLGALPATSAGPGIYSASVVLPAAGTWQLQVSLKISEFENPVAVIEFDVSS